MREDTDAQSTECCDGGSMTDDDMASCDCCGDDVPIDDIGRVVAYGIETYACGRCRGEDPREAREVERYERGHEEI